MPRFQVKILQVVLAAPGSALKVENADSVRAPGKTTSEAAPRWDVFKYEEPPKEVAEDRGIHDLKWSMWFPFNIKQSGNDVRN